jgi:hypothetical protein
MSVKMRGRWKRAAEAAAAAVAEEEEEEEEAADDEDEDEDDADDGDGSAEEECRRRGTDKVRWKVAIEAATKQTTTHRQRFPRRIEYVYIMYVRTYPNSRT